MKRSHTLLILAGLILCLGMLLLIFGGDRDAERAGVDVSTDTGPSLSSGPIVAPTAPSQNDRPDSGVRSVEGEDDSTPAGRAGRVRDGVQLRITDEYDVPITGASVRLARSSRRPVDALERYSLPFDEVRTDAAGTAVFRDVESGEVDLLVRKPGYETLEVRALVVAIRRPDDLGSQVMTPGGRLEGYVRDKAGVPVSGARIQAKIGDRSIATSERAPIATTDENGRFAVDGLALTRWELLVSHEAHPPKLFTGSFDVGSPLRSDLKLEMESGATISGRTSGTPERTAANLEAVARPMSSGLLALAGTPVRRARVSKTSKFEISGLTEGATYSVSLERRSGGKGAVGVQAVALAPSRDIELRWIEPAELTLEVLSSSGKPVPIELFVTLNIRGVQLRTEADGVLRAPKGRLVLGDLRTETSQGPCSITVGAVGFESVTRDGWQLAAGEQLDLGLMMMKPRPSVRVQVVQARSCEPLANVGVTVGAVIETSPKPGHFRAQTDAQGLAEVDLPNGQVLSFVVYRDDNAIYRTELPATDASNGTVVLEVLRLGTVDVLVVDGSGAPLGEARVRLSGYKPDGVTGSDGHVRFENVRPGAALIRSVAREAHRAITNEMEQYPARTNARIDFTVLEEGVTNVEITAALDSRLEGRLFVGAQPLAGAHVSMAIQSEAASIEHGLRAGGSSVDARAVTTDREGRFVVDGLRLGPWTCFVQHPERAALEAFPLVLELPIERVELELDSSVTRGQVTDASGRGIPQASVQLIRGRLEVSGALQSTDHWKGGMREAVSDERFAELLFRTTQGVEPTTRTDAEGRFQLRGLKPTEEWSLIATAPGWEIGWAPVRETEVELNLTLRRAGELALRIEDREGNLLRQRTWIQLRPTTDDQIGGTRKALALNGLLTIGSLPPGDYHVSIADGDSQRVTVTAGARSDVILRSERTPVK